MATLQFLNDTELLNQAIKDTEVSQELEYDIKQK